MGQGLPAELVLFRAVSVRSDARKYLDGAALKEGNVLERLDAEADEYLHEVAGRVRLAGLNIQPVVRHGPTPEAIREELSQGEGRAGV